tara:strand:- start:206 stop:634 length:429 start_codon:yes stop_codon:yes gene_type:complete
MSEKPYYETMYILRPDIPEDEVDSHLKKYSEILEKAGTEVLDNQMRGKRRLAYPISKHKEGIYVQLSHNGNGQQVAILEKAMRLSEDVIRYLTVKQFGPLPTPKSTAKDEEPKKSEKEEEIKPTEDKNESTAKDEKKEEAKE